MISNASKRLPDRSGRGIPRGVRTLLTAGCTLVLSAAAAPGPPSKVDVGALKWADPGKGRSIVDALLDRGRAGVVDLAKQLQPPAKGGDAAVRFALHGMVLRAAAPDTSDAVRSAVRAGLLDALAQVRDPDAKAFLLRQLRFVADASCVTPVAPLLQIPRLCDPAVAVLVEVGSPEAVRAVRQALDQAPPACVVHLVQALGLLHDAASVPRIVEYLKAGDKNLRRAAVDALADAAGADSAALLLKAGESAANREEKAHCLRACLRYAVRLGRQGQRDRALQFCRDLSHASWLPADASTKVALLDARVRLEGPAVLPDLLRWIRETDPVLRAAALELGARLPPATWTKALSDVLQTSKDPALQSAVVDALGRVGPAAVEPLIAALTSVDLSVRGAVLLGISRTGSERACNVLLDAAAAGRLEGVPEAAVRACFARFSANAVTEGAVRRLPSASAAGKRLLAMLLAANPTNEVRGHLAALANDSDPDVRIAALNALAAAGGRDEAGVLLKRAFDSEAPPAERHAARRAVAALCRREPRATPDVIEFLKKQPASAAGDALLLASQIGGNEALAFVTSRLDAPDAEQRRAALRALTRWPDASAVPVLAAHFEKATDTRTRILLLRSMVRLISSGKASPDLAADLAVRLWTQARGADEKRQLIAALGSLRNDRALAVLAQALDDPALKAEAAAAIVRAACPRGKNDRGMITAGAYAALSKVVKSGVKDLTEQARRHLQTMPPTAALGNAALGKPVTADVPQEGERSPERAVDGKLGKLDAWFGHRSPAHLTVDLQQTVTLGAVRVIFYWDGRRFYQYTIEASEDGKKWKKIVDASRNTRPSTAAGVVHPLSNVPARYLRLSVLRNSANPAVHVVELEAYPAGRVPKQFPVGETTAAAEPEPKTPLPPPDKDGYIPLFNGKDLTGWMGSVNGYFVENGSLVCDPKKGGMLLTEHQFRDFILRFDFKLTPGANNGVAIRAPAQGNPAYAGMEIQIIDNLNYERIHHYRLKPWQVHGSIYGVVPAKTGALKPAGEWNHEEIRAAGPHISVVLNGKTIVDADLNAIRETADGKGLRAHPGLRRTRGHIGWLGHGARVEFRNIRIKPLDYCEVSESRPPKDALPLFNGRDLTGWTGLCGNPETRAKMTPKQLAEARRKADADMRKHWRVENGALAFDGKGHSIGTVREYGDFDLWVDWKIERGGDSGIYLRGSPQVQIWDYNRHPEGSGGLYNNRKHPNKPLLCADRPIGEWNRFRIHMVGERVSVWLNGWLVVDNVVMENYWNRSKPIFPTGPIELQSHGSRLWFRNLFIREISRDKP